MQQLRILSPLRVLRFALLAVLGCLAVGNLITLVASLAPPDDYAKDFSQEYLLARVFWDGGNPYLPIRELASQYTGVLGYFDKTIPTPHPPTLGLLLVPLASLSYPQAVVVWFAVQLGCLVCSVALLARANNGWIGPWGTCLCALLLLAWEPVLMDLGLGQLTLPILALLAAAQLAMLRQRSALGGVLLGASLLLKPLAWPWLIVLLRRRDWRAGGAALAMVVVGYAVVAVRWGVGPVWTYVSVVLPQVRSAYAREVTNISWWTIGPRLLPDLPLGAMLLSLAAMSLLLGFTWMASGRRASLAAALGVATAASVLLNPISWQFSLVLALLPAASVVSALRANGYPPRATAAAGCIALLLCVYRSHWLALAASSPVWGLGPGLAVGLLAVFTFLMSRQPARPAIRTSPAGQMLQLRLAATSATAAPAAGPEAPAPHAGRAP